MKKEKTKSYNFICSLDLFPFDVYFSIGETNNKFNEGIKKYLFKEDYASIRKNNDGLFILGKCTNGRCVHNFNTNHTIIRLKKYGTNIDQGVLAHEIKHAIDFILWENLGIKPKLNNVELFAYATGYLTQQMFGKIYEK